jgi:uncharacterized protein YecE (DUF72 family)
VRRWAEVTPAGFTFDVKLHRLLSRHAAGPDALPPALRDDVEVNPRGRVVLTPELEAALAREQSAAAEPLRRAGKLSTFLLQLSPSFKPRDHRLDELAPLVEALAPDRVAIELRHIGWVDPERREDTLAWFERHGAVFVCVDTPQGRRAPTLMPSLDAVTRDDIAYLRAHGRNLEGYLRGRSVAERFAYHYDDEELREIGARAGGARRGGRRGARDVQQQPRRGRAGRRDPAARAAGPGSGGGAVSASPQQRLDAIADGDPRACALAASRSASRRRTSSPVTAPPTRASCSWARRRARGGPQRAPVRGQRGTAAQHDARGGRPAPRGRLHHERRQGPAAGQPRPARRRGRPPPAVARGSARGDRTGLLVPLGRHALARFAPDLKISQAHGRVAERDGRRLFPMYHPAAALHAPQLRETLLEDARALREALPS